MTVDTVFPQQRHDLGLELLRQGISAGSILPGDIFPGGQHATTKNENSEQIVHGRLAKKGGTAIRSQRIGWTSFYTLGSRQVGLPGVIATAAPDDAKPGGGGNLRFTQIF